MADPDALIVLLPLLIVLSTFLFILLTFLICALVVRRRRGIVLSDNDGPVDMSREELVEGDGGFDLLEARYVEGLSDAGRRVYARAKGAFYFAATAPLTFRQSTNCNIRPIRYPQTLRYLNFCRSRKRASPHGLLNLTTRRSTRCSSMHAQRSHSCPTPHQPPVSSQTSHFQSSMRSTTGK